MLETLWLTAVVLILSYSSWLVIKAQTEKISKVRSLFGVSRLRPQQWQILVVLAGLLQALALIVAFWARDAKSKADKRLEQSTGKISGKILDQSKPLAISVGGSTELGSVDKLRNGINLGDIIGRVNINDIKFNLPIKIYEENNRLLVDIEVYNSERTLVCSVVGNEWRFNPDGKYDRNYGVNAFEVVDGDLVPIVQVYLQDKNKIFLGGYVEQGGYFVSFTPGETKYSIDKNDIMENIVRLFKYPSSKHLGVFEDKENLPDFSSVDKYIAEQEKLVAAIAELSKLSNAELKAKALEVASGIKQLYVRYLRSEKPPDPSRRYEAGLIDRVQMEEERRLRDLEDRNRWEESEEAGEHRRNQEREQQKPYMVEYDANFKIEALALITVMIVQRLPQEASGEVKYLKERPHKITFYFDARWPYNFKDTAEALERFAENLK